MLENIPKRVQLEKAHQETTQEPMDNMENSEWEGSGDSEAGSKV